MILMIILLIVICNGIVISDLLMCYRKRKCSRFQLCRSSGVKGYFSNVTDIKQFCKEEQVKKNPSTAVRNIQMGFVWLQLLLLMGM